MCFFFYLSGSYFTRINTKKVILVLAHIDESSLSILVMLVSLLTSVSLMFLVNGLDSGLPLEHKVVMGLLVSRKISISECPPSGAF